MNDTQDRIALVTGGTRGIGAAISTGLAQTGARVAAVYNRDVEAADAFAKEASNNGLAVSLHQANVGNPGDCQRVVNEVKAGLFGLTKTLALETATKGITVNCVIPGAIKTDMVANLPEEIVKAVVDTIPMHALGTPEDVAEAVRYLVSDEAHYLTGTLIPVAGGWLMM